MILQKVNYFEFENDPRYWKIKDVNFEPINLIVGLNATGKSRLLSVISSLAKILTKKIPIISGNWEVEFKSLDNNEVFRFKLQLNGSVVIKEEIFLGNKKLLDRNEDKGSLWSLSKKEYIDIFPPKNELTLSIRRDRVEFPFFEDLISWAENFHGYEFTTVSPKVIAVPINRGTLLKELEGLNTVPFLLEEALKDVEVRNAIIEDFCNIGYPIKDVRVASKLIPNFPPDVKLIEIQETDLSCSTEQFAMSQGMFRAFSLIVIVEHIIRMNKYCTIAIDDLGEGLDYERSNKIIKLLFEKIKGSKIQLIVTSNDRFLINASNVRYLNILERKGHIVESFNYVNSKKNFEEFESIGLNIFDFFSSKMYKDKK